MNPRHQKPGMEIAPVGVFQPVDQVSYQAGSIVSREIVSRKAGTATIFAFDQGQKLSEHTAPFDTLVIGLEGEAEIFIGGEPFRVGAGDAIIMPAGVPHSLTAASRFKMFLIMIKG
jgi:quercetin dioxygenase-like cupin family protein